MLRSVGLLPERADKGDRLPDLIFGQHTLEGRHRRVKGLHRAAFGNAPEEEIITLFSGRMKVLIDKVEKELIAHYPLFSAKPEKESALSFLVLGASHVLIEARYEEAVLLDILPKLAKQVIDFINQSNNLE